MDEAEREPTGRFDGWDCARLEPFGQPCVVTNGPAVSADGRTLYAVDTVARTILAHTLEGRGIAFVKTGCCQRDEI